MKNKLILILSICSINSFAQTDSTFAIKKNNIQFDFGFVHSRLIDEGYTNNELLFRGTNPKFRLGYGRETEKYIFNFLLEVSAGKVTSASGELGSEFLNVRPTLEYLRNVKQYKLFGKESRFFAGINLNSNNYELENGPVFDNDDIFSVHGVYLGLCNQINLGKSQQVRITYLLPVVTAVTRIINTENNYSPEDYNHPLKMLSDNKSTSYFDIADFIQLKIGYEKVISRSTSVTATYNFFYMDSAFDGPIHMYSNELMIGLKIRL